MTTRSASGQEDPHLWLEDVEGDAALDWVRERNEVAVGAISADPDFDATKDRLLEIYDSDDRIPYATKRGPYVYNFWRDAEHPRGLWRRTSLASFRTDSPQWEVVIDVDALAESDEENWVWEGARCLYPDYDRCLILLSRGGADATVVREFDVPTKTFVEGGFELPEAKSRLGWVDRDTVYVGTDFGEGSLTESGYPRVVKEWRRGTSIDQAVTVFEGAVEDVSVTAFHDPTPGYERDFVYRGVTFYTNEVFQRTKKGLVKIDKPDGARFNADGPWLYLELREDWTIDERTFTAGSLLVHDFKKYMQGRRDFEVLFEPTDTSSLDDWSLTKNHLLLNVLDDVKNKLSVVSYADGTWNRSPLPGAPDFGTVSARALDPLEGDGYWLYISDYLTPSTLTLGEINSGKAEVLKQVPPLFDAEGLQVTQHFTTSEDGTRVPYFQVGPADTDGPGPTLLYGYGGFEVTLLPSYNAGVGAAWLERGGTYVVANIRGGGEYGPRWHQAALRDNRHRAYEDFAAVARDLVERGVTRPDQLGTQGGSNGGLLMGNMYTMYPELFGAIVCQVPLLDMKRYTKLLAGASWAGEYGDPDVPEDWAFIEGFSPYHNLDASAEPPPPMLMTTSTRDDRVHPGHARKMKAAIEVLGRDEVLYYENIEGGHGGAANNDQAAFMRALSWTFLWNTLTGEPMLPTDPDADAAEGSELAE